MNQKFLQKPAKGEAPTPDGFLGQDANGTLKSESPGWNQQWNFSTPEAPRKGFNPKGYRAGE